MDVDFDFYSKFKDHSTVALLIISKRPAGYRAEAIQAINQLLDERTISQKEIDEAEASLRAHENKAKNKPYKVNADEEETGDLLEPFTHPDPGINPAKWLYILLLVIGLQYLWRLYNFITIQISYLQGEEYPTNNFFYLIVVAQIYTPVVFYLVLKKNRWGWILLVAGVLNSLMAALIPFVYHPAYRMPFPGVSVTFVVFQLVKAVLCYFLWRRNMFDYFGISRNEEAKATLTVILIAALLCIWPGNPVLPVITRFW